MIKSVTYNFVIPVSSLYSLADFIAGERADFEHLYCQGGYSWGLQSYHILKHYDISIRLSHELDPECINLAHGNVLRSGVKRADCYCVSLQADFPHYSLAQYHIVQNHAQISGHSAYVPHWPQVSQIARNPGRSGVRRVAYQGIPNFSDLDADRLNADLNDEGIDFVLLDETRWKDLSEVDVLLGIRKFGQVKYKRKPPSKLLNAWHAEIPFVGGWDSAYSQIGVPGQNYLRVSSYNELVEKVIELKHSPELYQHIVAEGRKQSTEYTVDIIARRWLQLLEGNILNNYQGWSRLAAKTVRFRLKLCSYSLIASSKKSIQRCYKIEAVKRWRDLYYDPVK